MILHNYKLEFFHQGPSRQLSTEGGLFNRKIMDLDLCVRILSTKRDMNFDKSRYSNSFFSITIGLTSSINVLIDSFLSVEGSSNWNSLTLAQAAEFSWQAKKCYCYSYVVDIETHHFLKLTAWVLRRSQTTTFYLVEQFVKIMSCMFDQSFLHLFHGKISQCDCASCFI